MTTMIMVHNILDIDVEKLRTDDGKDFFVLKVKSQDNTEVDFYFKSLKTVFEISTTIAVKVLLQTLLDEDKKRDE